MALLGRIAFKFKKRYFCVTVLSRHSSSRTPRFPGTCGDGLGDMPSAWVPFLSPSTLLCREGRQEAVPSQCFARESRRSRASLVMASPPFLQSPWVLRCDLQWRKLRLFLVCPQFCVLDETGTEAPALGHAVFFLEGWVQAVCG